MSNGEQSAYPIHGGYQNDDPRNQIIGGGLTKREYFAAMAMNAIISNPGSANAIFGPSSLQGGELVAQAAIIAADALLKQLEV